MPIFKDCYVQVTTNIGLGWLDLSDSATVQIVTGAGLRPFTYLYQYGSDVAIIVPGKRLPVRLIITYNYTDNTQDNIIRAAYEAAGAFYVQYAPRGCLNGNFLYTSDAGIITTPPIPEGQRHSGAVVLNRFTFETPAFTKAVITIS